MREAGSNPTDCPNPRNWLPAYRIYSKLGPSVRVRLSSKKCG